MIEIDPIVGIDLIEKAKNVSSEIRIFGGPNNKLSKFLPLLDLVNADENEVFTLEAFKNIIIDSRKLNKDFIIARVTTSDPKDCSVFYNYYYSAFEINKILFKYESSRRLLHRMKVKNPLNNMPIIGQVSYYKISTQDFDRAIVDYYFDKSKFPKNRKSRKAFSEVTRDFDCKEQGEILKSKVSKDTTEISDFIEGNNFKTPTEIINDIRKGIIFVPTKDLDNKKIFYDARYFASDDDFLLKSYIREYFRSNSNETDEDFLFELDRANNDILALLDSASDSSNEGVNEWKRFLTCHMSVLLTMLCALIIFSTYAVIFFVVMAMITLIMFSLLTSIFYFICCRREAFDTLAVMSVDDI